MPPARPSPRRRPSMRWRWTASLALWVLQGRKMPSSAHWRLCAPSLGPAKPSCWYPATPRPGLCAPPPTSGGLRPPAGPGRACWPVRSEAEPPLCTSPSACRSGWSDPRSSAKTWGACSWPPSRCPTRLPCSWPSTPTPVPSTDPRSTGRAPSPPPWAQHSPPPADGARGWPAKKHAIWPLKPTRPCSSTATSCWSRRWIQLC